MKTKEELNALKEEVEALNTKLAELSEDELKQVAGGFGIVPFLNRTTGDITSEEELDGGTVMWCDVCGHKTEWAGYFLRQRFDCPMCGAKNSLVGKSLT